MASYRDSLRMTQLVREYADATRRAAVEAAKAAVPEETPSPSPSPSPGAAQAETVNGSAPLPRAIRRRLASPHSDQVFNDAVIGFTAGVFQGKNITGANTTFNTNIVAQAVTFASEFDQVLFNTFGSFDPTADQSNSIRDLVASVVADQYGTGIAPNLFDGIIKAILAVAVPLFGNLEPITPPSSTGPWQETPVGGPNGIISPIDTGASVEGGGATVSGGLERAFAWGEGSSVTEDDAVAFGGGVASAAFAFAVGQNTTDTILSLASAESAVAFSGGQATGQRAFAMGGLSTAAGPDSVALGGAATATTDSDVALGQGMALGGLSFAANGSGASGYNSASFNIATANAEQTFAANDSQAFELNDFSANAATSSGGASFGVNVANATGSQSFAANSSTAFGTNSAAFGESSMADGEGSFVACGGTTTFSGQIAMGAVSPANLLGQIYGPSPSCFIAIGDDSENSTIQIFPSELGFFGATPVAQQDAANATAGVAYTSVEQTMINQMFTALTNYGLLFLSM